MAYEKCQDCGHTWHGLPCERSNQRYEPATNRLTIEECDCKTSYKEVAQNA